MNYKNEIKKLKNKKDNIFFHYTPIFLISTTLLAEESFVAGIINLVFFAILQHYLYSTYRNKIKHYELLLELEKK